VVPQDSLCVLGDNRENSLDSRFWGFLPRKNLRGSPMFVYYSYDARSADAMPWVTEVRWGRVGESVK
jgi:signal peptidase I